MGFSGTIGASFVCTECLDEHGAIDVTRWGSRPNEIQIFAVPFVNLFGECEHTDPEKQLASADFGTPLGALIFFSPSVASAFCLRDWLVVRCKLRQQLIVAGIAAQRVESGT
jgi:hypothetical protein